MFIDDNNVAYDVTVTLDTTATVGDLTIYSGDTLVIPNYRELTIDGDLMNSGEISIEATTQYSDLRIENDVTLSGGGEVFLTDNQSRILDEDGDPDGHLINVDNTIHGRGEVGYDRTQITNQSDGIIDADISAATLYVDPNADGLVNQGTLQASGGVEAPARRRHLHEHRRCDPGD